MIQCKVHLGFKPLIYAVSPVLISPSSAPRSKSKQTPRPMSLSKFHQSPSPAKTPLEEITQSRNVNETIRDMLSPERIDTLVKRRPCLVLDVQMNEDDTNRIYTLLAVTHFDGKSIFETDIRPDKRGYALPIAPNTVDALDRAPLETMPAWPDNRSYQVLVPTPVAPDKVLSRDGRQ